MNKFSLYLFIFPLLVVTNIANGQVVTSIESTYLQTDRDVYIAGEDMFFKGYTIDAYTKKPLVMSKFAYLVLRNEKNAMIGGTCWKLENDMFSGSIYLPDTLSTGRYQLVSFTNCMRNQGEQSFYTKEIFVANRFDKDLTRIYNQQVFIDSFKINSSNTLQVKELLSVTTEKNIYGKRERIKIRLDGLGIQDNEIADFSISVHEKVPNFDSKLKITNYPAYDSRQLKNKSDCIYLPEINGIILEGKVNNIDNQNPITNTLVFLSTPDSVSNLQFTQTNQSGNFKFQLNDYYTDKNLIINLPRSNKAIIELNNKYELKIPFKPTTQFSDSLLKNFLIKSQNIVQVQKTFKIESRKDDLGKATSKSYPLLVYPPVKEVVYPADFVSLPDFVEISREILPLLKTRKHKDIYEARMVDLQNIRFFDSDPLLFLDGVPINNISQVIKLGSDKINKIESIGEERYFGNLYFSGIVAIFTKKMEINNINWQTPTLFTKYAIIQPSSLFIGPNYSKVNKEPDFRQLLFWEPSLTLRSKETKYIEFQSSDNTGEFIITIDGITTQGNLVSANSTIKIANHAK